MSMRWLRHTVQVTLLILLTPIQFFTCLRKLASWVQVRTGPQSNKPRLVTRPHIDREPIRTRNIQAPQRRTGVKECIFTFRERPQSNLLYNNTMEADSCVRSAISQHDVLTAGEMD